MAQYSYTGNADNDLLDASALTSRDIAVMHGGAGSDTLIGGAGNDRLSGDEGADSMAGGAGDDQFFVSLDLRSPFAGRDSIEGGTGNDELIITVSGHQFNAAVEAEFGRLAGFLAAAGPAAHFTSDLLRLDLTGVEAARVRLDGTVRSFADMVHGPEAVADSFDATEDTTLLVDAAHGLLANDSALAGGPKVVAGTFATALGGSVSVAADGSFTYVPRANANGQDSFAYTITDALGRSATATASLGVAAVADNAVIGGTGTGAVAEDGTLTASGRLTIADPDAGQAAFAAPAAASLQGTYGSFTFDPATGAWGYTLDNGAAQVQALAAGQHVTDRLTVASLDGTASQDIVAGIDGANEAVLYQFKSFSFTHDFSWFTGVGNSSTPYSTPYAVTINTDIAYHSENGVDPTRNAWGDGVKFESGKFFFRALDAFSDDEEDGAALFTLDKATVGVVLSAPSGGGVATIAVIGSRDGAQVGKLQFTGDSASAEMSWVDINGLQIDVKGWMFNP